MFPLGISSERVADVQLVPEEGIMPKHFKNIAVRTCALACVAGLSLNSFAFAVAASAKTAGKSARATRVDLAALPEPSPTPLTSSMASNPAKDNTTQQPSQGRQYGQAGFAGEPINLNVVNADVRDILNYITEQYGINFVIDSSVGAVPVTVNVQDVPWNYALDAILRANKL